MSGNSAKKISIDFGPYGKKAFASIPELKQWVDREKEFWGWIWKLGNTDNDLVRPLANRINPFLKHINADINRITDIASEVEADAIMQNLSSYIGGYIRKNNLLLSDTPEAHFIEKIKEKDELVAAYALSAMYGFGFNQNSAASIEGFFLAIAFKHGLKDRSANERSALEALYREWRELQAESKTKFLEATQEYEAFRELHEKELQSRKDEFDRLVGDSTKVFEELLATSTQELKNIETTYDEKLALQAAVQYWKQKAKSHGSAANWLAFASSVVGIVVALFIGAEVFYAIGPLQSFGDLPIWKGAMLLLTAIIGVWAIRILVRLLLSNLHLKSDAIERRTMLLTYLALLRKGQGPSDNQREVLLHILFRPTATGLVKDDALPPIVAQWLNTITS